MGLVVMVFRKMYKNKGFIAFLIVGLLISSALMSSIPMYTQGVLQKVLIKDMEGYQTTNGNYPGVFNYSVYSDDGTLNDILKAADGSKNLMENDGVKKYYKNYLEDFIKLEDYSKKSFQNKMSLPVLSEIAVYSTEPRKMIHDNFKAGDFDDSTFARVQGFEDFEKHIKLTDGKLPEKEKQDGVYEVLVSEGALSKLKMTLNRVYVLSDVQKKGYADVKIKPVGVFTAKDGDELFWSNYKLSNLDEVVVMDNQLMLKDFIKTEPTQLDYASWSFVLDYHSIKLSNVDKLYGEQNNITNNLADIRNSVRVTFPIKELTQSYVQKESQLKNMLWSLDVPVMIMLCIYLFMVSKLIIDKEKNEISLLISRGASRVQVVFGYVIEGLILALISAAAGPFLGLLLTRLLGSSNGFLQFVDRKALDVGLSTASFGYSLLASAIFLITLLVPAYKASSTSIVDYKRKKARGTGKVIWEKIFLDIILLSVAAYGYYSFNQRQHILKATAAAVSEVQVDPILFFIPVIFILGISLLCLRIYPLFLKIIYRLGRKFWPPSVYGTLIQISRSSASYNFIMVFIMLTLSIGIFSATAARTINNNGEDRISYRNGADLVLTTVWDKLDSSAAAPPVAGAAQTSSQSQGTNLAGSKTIQYIEPPFEPYESLPGVEHAAKVYNKSKVWTQAGKKTTDNVNLMAIDPYDFGNTLWFRNGLLSHHINEYLNLLSSEESSCIISKTLSDSLGVKEGDSLSITWDGNKAVVLNVYGIVDYWPTEIPEMVDNELQDPNYIITNLSYIQNSFPKEPYNVWLKLKPGADRDKLYKAMGESKYTMISQLKDTNNDIINLKNDPGQLAINGSLTMGFLISGVICFLGFILYWILSLKERNLQFGILRAIGLSAGQLRFMMFWEQALTSGIAMLLGAAIGTVSSKIYVIFFQISSSYAEQIPPFKVVSYLSDKLKVYEFLGITFVIGLGILIYLLSRIKISNVIKLGED